LVAFLGEHWPKAAPDVLRILLEHSEWKLWRYEPRWRIEITAKQRDFIIKAAKSLKGRERRMFMARVVRVLGKGGQRRAEQEFGWSRGTIRRGMHDLKSGFSDHLTAGRKRAEDFLPDLLHDIRIILADNPRFLVPVSKIREELITRKGYRREDLPSDETIRKRRNLIDKRLFG
jgi:hypothetical protein